MLSTILLAALPLLALAHTPISSNNGPQHARMAAKIRAEGLAHLERNIAAGLSPPLSPAAALLVRKDLQAQKRRCKVRPASAAPAAATSSTSVAAPPPAPTTTSTPAPSPTPSTEPVYVAPPFTSSPVVEAAVRPTTTSTPAPAATSPSSSNNNNGFINVNDGRCGNSGASSQFPNGNIDWLNCGVNGGGWTPPYVHVNELKAADLGQVVSSGSSPFGPCAPYMDKMYQYGAQFGVPAIMVASFAMQESTCNPNAVGGGGEQGMFQISQDKCGGAPGGNCRDVDFNMRTAMKYFSDTLAQNGGDVFKSIGAYNGWQPGMTVGSATAARWGGCCRCQNNLDYLNEFVNGWMQGKNGYAMGIYNNLAVCG